MRYFYLFLLLISALSVWSQTIQELESSLAAAATNQEKMDLYYRLGEAYLRTDTKKALEYSRQAHNLSIGGASDAMAAQSAYLLGQVYERDNNDRNAEVWYRTTLTFAKKVGDSDLIIKSVDKRSKIAVKDRNYRRAYDINQEAFEYFSQKGLSISDLERKYDQQRNQLEREKRTLEAERTRLQTEIQTLSTEKDQLSTEKTVLTEQQLKLQKEKDKVESQVNEKEEKLAEVTEQKAIVEELAKTKEQEVKALTREALEKQATIEAARADLMTAKLAEEQSRNLLNMSLFTGGFVLVLALLFFTRFRLTQRSRRELEEKNKIIKKEQERSERLLLNILPQPIAEELKEKGKARARKFEEVTVLFTDFKNFTQIAEMLTPEELVEELDKCFKAFDLIIARYPDIEKIKTIGDSYMCVSGLTEQKTFPYNIIRAAFEFQRFLEEQKQERQRLSKPFFEARIGVHTGPVVAGVVGVNKFAYDIWGDTVNTASRMEANCEPGKINISESTYRNVKYQFLCEHRGKIPAKHKGMVDMYYVVEEKTGAGV